MPADLFAPDKTTAAKVEVLARWPVVLDLGAAYSDRVAYVSRAHIASIADAGLAGHWSGSLHQDETAAEDKQVGSVPRSSFGSRLIAFRLVTVIAEVALSLGGDFQILSNLRTVEASQLKNTLRIKFAN